MFILRQICNKIMAFFVYISNVWYACFDDTVASSIHLFLADLNENIQY